MNLANLVYNSKQVRVVGTSDNPWWVAKDVCEILNQPNISQVVSRLDDDEKDIQFVETPGGQQEMLCVNESGLYCLVLSSRKREAKNFKKWITSEVLPSIRKTGRYETSQSVKAESNYLVSPESCLTILNGLLDPLAAKGVDIALVQATKANALAAQFPQLEPMILTTKQSPVLEVADADRRYSPTRLGEMYAQKLGLAKPVAPKLINKALELKGFQVPEYRINSKGKQILEWRLTKAGEEYGKVLLESGQYNNKTVAVVRWLPSVLGMITL
jgi:prophage antirepressor-like protein